MNQLDERESERGQEMEHERCNTIGSDEPANRNCFGVIAGLAKKKKKRLRAPADGTV
jgi:hypothetical protein